MVTVGVLTTVGEFEIEVVTWGVGDTIVDELIRTLGVVRTETVETTEAETELLDDTELE